MDMRDASAGIASCFEPPFSDLANTMPCTKRQEGTATSWSEQRPLGRNSDLFVAILKLFDDAASSG